MGVEFLALFFTMVVCLILGMGLPTTAAYVLAASVAGPALIKLGVVPMAAQLFVFYFAIIPPSPPRFAPPPMPRWPSPGRIFG